MFTDTNCAAGCNNGTSGYYVGAGLDLEAHKDFLGVKGMTLHGEIATMFARLNSSTVLPAAAALLQQNGVRSQQELTLFNLTISPKLKFRHGEKFRPWIIPIGLSYTVISPPSNNTNYLDFGAVFGAGAEYNFYGPFNLGVEARWNLMANQTGSQNSFGQAGMYLGILF